MKIYLQAQVFNSMEHEYALEYKPPSPLHGKLELHYYLVMAYIDYHKNHMNGRSATSEDHDELCSWCNFHAAILDACAGVTDYKTCTAWSKSKGCEYCLSRATWYKKL